MQDRTFTSKLILKAVREASQPTTVEEARVVGRYDAYYLDPHGQHPLPAFLVRLNDAARSAFYVDLKTARLVEAYDRRSRWNRRLYHGLHSWNLPWLYSHRPAWDAPQTWCFSLLGECHSLRQEMAERYLVRKEPRTYAEDCPNAPVRLVSTVERRNPV